VGRDASQPVLIAQGLGQDFGLPEMVERAFDLTEGIERALKFETKIDGLFHGDAALRKPPQGGQRLLKARDRLAQRAAGLGLGGCLLEIAQRLVPHLAAERMVGQRLDVLHQAVGMERLDRLHDLGVKGASPIVQQTFVGHLVRQGVLEGVLEIGE
jgi:hypothetical protein